MSASQLTAFSDDCRPKSQGIAQCERICPIFFELDVVEKSAVGRANVPDFYLLRKVRFRFAAS